MPQVPEQAPRFNTMLLAFGSNLPVAGESSRAIVEKALGIAADICVYTNHSLTIEEL